MRKEVLALIFIISLIALSAGCIGSNGNGKTSTKTITETQTLFKTKSTTYHITHVTTKTIILFSTKTYVKTETLSYPVITTIVISGTSTSTMSTNDTLHTTIMFAYVNNVIMLTTSNTIIIKVPYEASIFSNELYVFSTKTSIPFPLDRTQYPRIVFLAKSYTIAPAPEPTSSGTFIDLGLFMGLFASKNISKYGKVTFVKIFTNNIFIDEYVVFNNTYYGTSMFYGVLQFQGMIFSKYKIATAKMLIVDAKGLPLAYNVYTITTGTVKSLQFEGATGKINDTPFTIVNGIVLITTTTTSKSGFHVTTITVTTQPQQTDIKFGFLTESILPDYEIFQTYDVFIYICPSDKGVVVATLVHLGGKMYQITGNIYNYPIGETEFTGSILLK